MGKAYPGLPYRGGQRRPPAVPVAPGLSKGQLQGLLPWGQPGYPPRPANDDPRATPRRMPPGAVPNPHLAPATRPPLPANRAMPWGRVLGGLAARANPYLRAFDLGRMIGEVLGEIIFPVIWGAPRVTTPEVAAQPGFYDFTGWTITCAAVAPTSGPTILGRGLGCGATGFFSPASWNAALAVGIDDPVPNTYHAVFYRNVFLNGVGNIQGIKDLHAQRTMNPFIDPFVDPVPAVAPVVSPAVPAPLRLPGNLPEWLPAIAPQVLPLVGPAPFVRPIPWRLAPYRRRDPNRAPTEQTQTGPRPQPSPEPNPVPGGVQTPPSGRGPMRKTTSPHRQKPPKKNEKQRKFKLGLGGTAIGFLLNLATESADFIESFYWAIDKDARAKWWHENAAGKRKLSPQQMLAAIFANLDHMDWGKALQNLAENQLEDAIIGAVAGGIGRNWHKTPGGDKLPTPLVGPTL